MHQMRAHFKAQFSYDLNCGHGRGMAVPATGDGLVAPMREWHLCTDGHATVRPDLTKKPQVDRYSHHTANYVGSSYELRSFSCSL